MHGDAGFSIRGKRAEMMMIDDPCRIEQDPDTVVITKEDLINGIEEEEAIRERLRRELREKTVFERGVPLMRY